MMAGRMDQRIAERDLLTHREQNRAIQTAVKSGFLSLIKRAETIFSVKYQKTSKQIKLLLIKLTRNETSSLFFSSVTQK